MKRPSRAPNTTALETNHLACISRREALVLLRDLAVMIWGSSLLEGCVETPRYSGLQDLLLDGESIQTLKSKLPSELLLGDPVQALDAHLGVRLLEFQGSSATIRDLISERIKSDFLELNVVQIGGWFASKTEGLLIAVVAKFYGA